MNNSTNQVSWWRGALTIPAMAILSLILQGRVGRPIAFSLSVGVVLFVFFLFEARKQQWKQSVVLILFIAVGVYLLATVFRC
jgi:hypothetical protein